MSASWSSVGVSLELAEVMLTDRQCNVWVEVAGPGLLASPILRLSLDVACRFWHASWADQAMVLIRTRGQRAPRPDQNGGLCMT